MASSSSVLSHGVEITGGKKRTVCDPDALKKSANKQSRQDQDGQSFDPDSDIENKDNNLHLNMGTFNNDVGENESDDYEQAEVSTLEESWCRKKEIHKDYIPFGTRSFPSLPETYDREEIAGIVEALGKLTVKIVVAKTSAKRPEVFRGTIIKYPSGKIIGTGKINFSKPFGNPGNGWGEIRIVTCAHVVHHQSEAKHTTCILNYDSKDSPTTELKCKSVQYVNVENDRSELLCVTSDVELAQKLKKDVYHFLNTHQELHAKYKNVSENNLVLTVSHPHGCPKCVSVGKYTDKKSFKSHLPNKINTKYTYLLTTCTGSSGAPIYRLDKESVRTLHPHSMGDKFGAEFGGVSGVEWEEITI